MPAGPYRSSSPDYDDRKQRVALIKTVATALTESNEVAGEGFILRLAEICVDAVLEEGDMVPGALAQRFKDERNVAKDRYDRLITTIAKCRESAGLQASPSGPSGDVQNMLGVIGLARQPAQWAKLLLKRDDVQGRKVLERMIEYYEQNDGKADDFGRLRIVIDASIALGREQ